MLWPVQQKPMPMLPTDPLRPTAKDKSFRERLTGIMLMVVVGARVIAKYFVPASTIRVFMPIEVSPLGQMRLWATTANNAANGRRCAPVASHVELETIAIC